MAPFRNVLGRIARGRAAPGAVTLAILAVCFSFVASVGVSQTSQSGAERELFDLANRERADRNLPTLRWDNALAEAARVHARRMAEEGALSHQFRGEASLGDRAHRAGASYAVIAENVAEGPSAATIHAGWMHSPPHRANLLDPELSAIGIAVVRSGAILFAVQDFSHAVANLSLSEQEKEVAALIAAQNLKVSTGGSAARNACSASGNGAGAPGATVIRYESGDLSKLPDTVTSQIRTGRYRAAEIGACKPTPSKFTNYRIAILIY